MGDKIANARLVSIPVYDVITRRYSSFSLDMERRMECGGQAERDMATKISLAQSYPSRARWLPLCYNENYLSRILSPSCSSVMMLPKKYPVVVLL